MIRETTSLDEPTRTVAMRLPMKLAALALSASVALLGATATLARAELVQHGDLFVTFDGGIAPGALPRHPPSPIAVHVAATVRTLSGERPPALRRITIALNRHARLDTHGLPLCSIARIEATSTRAALAACAPALIGTGSFAAKGDLPEQADFPSSGRILAFNALVGGHRAILAHIYGTEPLSIARIVTFHLHIARGGAYGAVLSATLSRAVNSSGYIKRIALDLHRTYTYRGARHSYISAACTAPRGFPGAVFPFARVSMGFEGGGELASTLTRSCRVSR